VEVCVLTSTVDDSPVRETSQAEGSQASSSKRAAVRGCIDTSFIGVFVVRETACCGVGASWSWSICFDSAYRTLEGEDMRIGLLDAGVLPRLPEVNLTRAGVAEAASR
jgi:hypothetical protein